MADNEHEGEDSGLKKSTPADAESKAEPTSADVSPTAPESALPTDAEPIAPPSVPDMPESATTDEALAAGFDPFSDDLFGEAPSDTAAELPETTEPDDEAAAEGDQPTVEGEAIEPTAALEETPAEGQEGEPETPKAAPSAKQGLLAKLATNPKQVEWGALGGVAVIAVVLFVLKVIFLPTVVYVIAVAGVAYGIWKGRETNTLYTVFLGCALIALLTAVLCLWIELQRYGYNIKAKSRGPQAAVTQSFGLDSPDSSAIGAAKPQEVWAIV